MRKNTDLKGIVGASVTPINSSYEIDLERLKNHCEKLLSQGCDFISVFGTTGEGASFSAQQKIHALREMSAQGMDMSRQIPGIIASSIDDAAALYKVADELGCRAALIIPPYYYPPSGDKGVGDFYEAVVAAAGSPDLDVILYNFPVFSGVAFTPALVKEVVSRLGHRVVGIKDSTGDLAGGLELVSSFPDLSIFTGDDRVLTRLVSAGGAGMIGGLPNLFPADSVTLYRGDVDPAFESRAAKRIELVDGLGGLIALKAMLAETYNLPSFSQTMPPLLGLSNDVRAQLKVELEL
ncbi:dihydrodipicolinate synthase family protein [Marinomonas transparens]|uniref:Dihydrodipicolinate synthase family protein n=1 Tax=Marinomonas transparens TaxID=2795388 RepID=A0A934N5V3_9GAMM|nr:dihydrodipicolinate synthase family protein [Marinomonas transparens]MBJ7537431.1 dihydrodipicolinate synthase family protein [Marinomonas transparens]